MKTFKQNLYEAILIVVKHYKRKYKYIRKNR
jgi:hypothetical protein